MKLEEKNAAEPIAITPEQAAFFEKRNPSSGRSLSQRDCWSLEFSRETVEHPYELYLSLNDIEHRRAKEKSPKTNGFVERFNGTVLDEFFRVKMRDVFYDKVEALQADLDDWLVHDDTERPKLGDRNQGRRPIETVSSFVRQEA